MKVLACRFGHLITADSPFEEESATRGCLKQAVRNDVTENRAMKGEGTYFLVDEHHEGSTIFRDDEGPLLDDVGGVGDEIARAELEGSHLTFVARVVLYAREALRADLGDAVSTAEAVEDGQLGEGAAAKRAMATQVSFDPIVS